MGPVRVLVVAADPLARAGLATLLSAEPDIEVVGRAAGDPDATAAAELNAPQVVVWDAGWQSPPLEKVAALAEEDRPVLLLLGDDDQAAVAWQAGIRGLLRRSGEAAQLATAISALAAGLAVVDPAFAPVLRASRPPATAGAGPAQLPEPLTPRELEVLRLLADGLPNKTIASRLQISEHTVKFHVNSVLAKLGAASRTEAVVNATRLGLILL